jgi:hypothetical protein
VVISTTSPHFEMIFTSDSALPFAKAFARCRVEPEGWMHSAILAAELPPDNRAGRETWQLFSAMIADLKGDPGIKQLGPNVWQTNFQQSPYVLARLVSACEKTRLRYQVLPFDSEPAWKQGGDFTAVVAQDEEAS